MHEDIDRESGWVKRAGDPVFDLRTPEMENVGDRAGSIDALQQYFANRTDRAASDVRELPGWLDDPPTDPRLHLFIDVEIAFSGRKSFGVGVTQYGQSREEPALVHELAANVPVENLRLLGFEKIPCGIFVVMIWEMLASAYAAKRGWAPPDRLPRTRAEREWTRNHGDEAIRELLPGHVDFDIPQRPSHVSGRTVQLLEGLDEILIEDRARAFVEVVESARPQQRSELINGWFELMSELEAGHNRKSARESLPDIYVSSDAFADVRACVLLSVSDLRAVVADKDAFANAVGALSVHEELAIAHDLVEEMEGRLLGRGDVDQ